MVGCVAGVYYLHSGSAFATFLRETRPFVIFPPCRSPCPATSMSATTVAPPHLISSPVMRRSHLSSCVPNLQVDPQMVERWPAAVDEVSVHAANPAHNCSMNHLLRLAFFSSAHSVHSPDQSLLPSSCKPHVGSRKAWALDAGSCAEPGP